MKSFVMPIKIKTEGLWMLRRLINNLTFSKPKWGPKAPAGPTWFLPLPRELEYCLLENRVVGIRDAQKGF